MRARESDLAQHRRRGGRRWQVGCRRVAEVVQRRCSGGAGAVQERCRGGAGAVQGRCRGGAEAVQRRCKGDGRHLAVPAIGALPAANGCWWAGVATPALDGSSHPTASCGGIARASFRALHLLSAACCGGGSALSSRRARAHAPARGATTRARAWWRSIARRVRVDGGAEPEGGYVAQARGRMRLHGAGPTRPLCWRSFPMYI